ncbi:unnamed protein product [Gordionus sp. m RMFG-2023]|uniref:translation machinery-associated protein 16-like n=1 Tax=Gordionus sp. m RMFG-2023 TaxID=3053472 RepID=UPI0030DECD32
MTKTKTKIIAKKNQKIKIVHPKSRKAQKLLGEASHYKKASKSHRQRNEKTNLMIKKLLWFKNHITSTDIDKTFYSVDELRQIIANYYINRFDDELDQIHIINTINKDRKGRRHVPRETAITLTKNSEMNEFEGGGLAVPDITSQKQLHYFKNIWNGEENLLPNIKMCYIKKEII